MVFREVDKLLPQKNTSLQAKFEEILRAFYRGLLLTEQVNVHFLKWSKPPKGSIKINVCWFYDKSSHQLANTTNWQKILTLESQNLFKVEKLVIQEKCVITGPYSRYLYKLNFLR